MSIDHDLHVIGMRYKFWYSMAGLVLGLACIIAGVVLGLSGVSGHTSWTANLLGLSTSMSDAAPGVIIFVVGIFLVLITRFKVSQKVTGYRPAPPSDDDEKRPPSNEGGGGGGGSGGGFHPATSQIDYATHPTLGPVRLD